MFTLQVLYFYNTGMFSVKAPTMHYFLESNFIVTGNNTNTFYGKNEKPG